MAVSSSQEVIVKICVMNFSTTILQQGLSRTHKMTRRSVKSIGVTTAGEEKLN